MEDTEFEGGFYHGVIKLPNSYPLKPPNIMFLTVEDLNFLFVKNMKKVFTNNTFKNSQTEDSMLIWMYACLLQNFTEMNGRLLGQVF